MSIKFAMPRGFKPTDFAYRDPSREAPKRIDYQDQWDTDFNLTIDRQDDRRSSMTLIPYQARAWDQSTRYSLSQKEENVPDYRARQGGDSMIESTISVSLDLQSLNAEDSHDINTTPYLDQPEPLSVGTTAFAQDASYPHDELTPLEATQHALASIKTVLKRKEPGHRNDDTFTIHANYEYGPKRLRTLSPSPDDLGDSQPTFLSLQEIRRPVQKRHPRGLHKITLKPTDHPLPAGDVFSTNVHSEHAIQDSDDHDDEDAAEALQPSLQHPPPESRTEQWRVGKMPGHQGSYVKTSGEEVGLKRSLHEAINDSAERVLKKPFRTPGVVLTKVAQSRPPNSNSSPTSMSDTLSPASTFAPFSSPTKTSNQSARSKGPPSAPSSTPLSRARQSNTKAHSARLSKPFKTPVSFARSTAPSPSSTSSSAQTRELTANSQSSSHSRWSSATARTELAQLEKQALVLRQAIRHVKYPEEDTELTILIRQWRAAGRNVAEQLFQLVPDPTSPASGEGTNDLRSGMGLGRSSFARGWGDESSYLCGNGNGQGSILNEEQREYLRNAPTNANGDAVDDEGNLLLEEPGDILKVLQGNGKRYGQPTWRGTYEGGEEESYGLNGEESAGKLDSTSQDWTIGTMLLKFQIDPHLLGWDADAEDWAELDDGPRHDDDER